MKNLIRSIALTAFLFTSVFASAQRMPAKSPEKRAENQVAWMQKKIGITEDQRKKAFDIILKYGIQVDELKNTPKSRARKSEIIAINSDRDSELQSVLSEEQFRQYKAHEQDLKDRMKERHSEMQNGSGN